MRPLLVPARMRATESRPVRAVEATPQQVAASGASLGSWGQRDPLDDDVGWRPAGSTGRQVPPWTQEKARMFSVAAYRTNPMAKAIIDTYTAFCVGDSGVKHEAHNPQVRAVVDEFWNDPANRVGSLQDLWLRDQLLNGETLTELMEGQGSGVVRFAPINPALIENVHLRDGNPLWVDRVTFTADTERQALTIVAVDDSIGLRAGKGMFWTPFKALIDDDRSMPFLSPILDWLDNYDTVLSNLMDRTALARYLVWDVTVNGGQPEVDAYVKARGGNHIPRSGSVEVHNESVKWDAKTASTGAFEDTEAARAVLTGTAAGAGLAKTWLAEPDGANRATSLSMAEPVRRRISGVQKLWLDYQAETLRFVVDRAVAAKRLPATVKGTDPKTGEQFDVKASQTVAVTGPEIAAADAQISATVLMNLSVALEKLKTIGALTPAAAEVAARKGWEDFMGVPYRAELSKPDGDVNDVATHVDDSADGNPSGRLRAL